MGKIKRKPENFEPPQATIGDTVHLVTSGLLSFIPGAPELFQYFVTPPLEKRRQAWMEEVGRTLRELQEKREIDIDDLQSNDDFIDTVLQATQIALRNNQQEKRRALRNMILNAALQDAPEQSLQQIFLYYIDIFTVWHIKILMFFHEPALTQEVKEFEHRSQVGGGLSIILEKKYPELIGSRALYDLVWNDLYTKGLVNTENLHSKMSGKGLLVSRSTDIGKKFIKFIQEPV